ncbi:MAG: hypothetical protein IJ852_06345 [Alphaproteobacteria bacterium]|nr:hypothetical protein [Alphaproteobacteria bacterium]
MLKAISDRIIVSLCESAQSSLIITDDKAYCHEGIVRSVGPLVNSVKIGDRIVFHVFDELPLPQDKLAVIREKSLLGIYTD